MPKRVVIIGDGKFPKSEYPRYLIRTADFIICCDGALKKFLKNAKAIFGEERLPDLVIGDMDSLSLPLRQKYADIIIKIDEQEHNDQTKAFTWAIGNIENISSICLLYGSALTTVHYHWEDYNLDYIELCWQSNVSAFEYAI